MICWVSIGAKTEHHLKVFRVICHQEIKNLNASISAIDNQLICELCPDGGRRIQWWHTCTRAATPRTGESPPMFYVSVISLSPSSSPSHLHNGPLELTRLIPGCPVDFRWSCDVAIGVGATYISLPAARSKDYSLGAPIGLVLWNLLHDVR